MKALLIAVFCLVSMCRAQSSVETKRNETEYYVAIYAKHYGVPLALVRVVVDQESSWRPCAVSSKGAVGLMQLMPVTARMLGATDPSNLDQNVSGGVRYLAWLMHRFHNDLRLVVAAYYVGEDRIGNRGLAYRNSDVFAYVSRIRTTYVRETGIMRQRNNVAQERDVR
jgi:soluble lytic murein transglycosylase-like protein